MSTSTAKPLQRTGVVICCIIGLALVAALSAWLVDKIQRERDYAALISAVKDTGELQAFADQTPQRDMLLCKPGTSQAEDCPALLYKISKEDCIELQRSFDIKKEHCGASVPLSYQDRDITLQLGEVYSGPTGYYVQVIMNEKNLLTPLPL